MTFYIGQKSAGEIFLGSKKIGRLYLGQTLIHMTKVVSKPTFLEYVEFDGKSYIDTGYCPNENTYVEFTFECIVSPTGYCGLFGSRKAIAEMVYCVFHAMGGTIRADFGGGAQAVINSTVGEKHTIKAGLGSVYFDGAERKTYTVTTGQSPYSMYLGTLSTSGTPFTPGTTQKIYGFKAHENGVLLQDLRPCLDPKGVVCFYDAVTKTYFYNQGTGELKAGEPLAEHEELEYLEFDGTHCIDTGLYPNSNMRVESTFVYEGHTEDDGFIPSRGMYGAKGSGSYIALYSDGYQKWGGVNSVYMEVSVFKDKKVNAVQDKNGVVVDGVLYEYTSVPEDFVNTTNTFLIGDTNGSSARPFIGKMYGLKLYENNVLLRDFVPVKRSDGVVCMYDRVENKYYELKEA